MNFDRVGLTVRVFEDACEHANSAGNRRNGERVLSWALEHQADLLFVEDDIDLAPDFSAALVAARGLGAPVTFWLDLPQNQPAWDGVGFYRVTNMHGWRGSQALLLPLACIERAARAPSFGDGKPPPTDIFLKSCGALANLHAAMPNPVQHRSPPCVVDPTRPVRMSPTFGLPRVGDWSARGENL